MMNRTTLIIATAWFAACGSAEETDPDGSPSAVVASGVTVVEGAAGTDFDGVALRIPEGAVPEGTEVSITLGEDATPLPTTARAVGQQFEVRLGAEPVEAVQMTVPFRPDAVANDYGQMPTMVKVWLRRPDLEQEWERLDQIASTSGTVTVELDRSGALAAGVNVPEE